MNLTCFRTNFLTGRILTIAMMTFFVFSQAQASNDPVARWICFDADTPNGGGWAAIVTQIDASMYPADIFIPNDNGEFDEKFPMFQDIQFIVSIFPSTQGADFTTDDSTLANLLLGGPNAPLAVLAEGNRVGTLLDIRWDGSASLRYDTQNQDLNLFSEPTIDEERKITCKPPFIVNG